MNRLTALVMLVCFVAQQFACCCDGCGVATCSHEHHEDVTPGSTQAVECDESDCSHDHERDFHSHSTDGLSHADDESDGPCDHSHQHHLCFVSHIFFTGTPRAELPPQNLSTGWVCLLAYPTAPLAMLVLGSMAPGVDSGPPLSSCPQRSALCVYRI